MSRAKTEGGKKGHESLLYPGFSEFFKRFSRKGIDHFFCGICQIFTDYLSNTAFFHQDQTYNRPVVAFFTVFDDCGKVFLVVFQGRRQRGDIFRNGDKFSPKYKKMPGIFRVGFQLATIPRNRRPQLQHAFQNHPCFFSELRLCFHFFPFFVPKRNPVLFGNVFNKFPDRIEVSTCARPSGKAHASDPRLDPDPVSRKIVMGFRTPYPFKASDLTSLIFFCSINWFYPFPSLPLKYPS